MIIGSKSAILLQWGPVDPKFQVEGSPPANNSSSRKTRLNDLSYSIKIWADFSSVLSQFKHVMDGQTDGQTEFSSLDRICISCIAVKSISTQNKHNLTKFNSLSLSCICTLYCYPMKCYYITPQHDMIHGMMCDMIWPKPAWSNTRYHYKMLNKRTQNRK